MAHGFSVVCAHDVFEQFFRWPLIASVDPSVKTQRNALQTIKMANEDVYSFSSDACADKMPMCSFHIDFCVCYLHMQMQTLCRAVEISITTSYSTSVKFFYRGLTEVFITSPFCDYVYEGQVKRNHLSWICREPRWMSSLNRELL